MKIRQKKSSKLLVVGSSPIGLIHAIQLVENGNEVSVYDSNPKPGAAWSNRKIHSVELEFAWHAFSLEGNNEKHATDLIKIFKKLGMSLIKRNSLKSLDEEIDRTYFNELNYLSCGLSSGEIVSRLKEKAKDCGVNFGLKKNISYVRETKGGVSVHISPESRNEIFDKIFMPSFIRLPGVDTLKGYQTMPFDHRLSIHVVLELKGLKGPVIPPLDVNLATLPENSFDLVNEIFPSSRGDQSNGSRFLVVRLARNFKDKEREHKKIFARVIYDLRKLGLLRGDISSNSLSIQFYDIFYRTENEVKNINNILPKKIRIYLTNDILIAFDNEYFH